jgi:hypothetical protein
MRLMSPSTPQPMRFARAARGESIVSGAAFALLLSACAGTPPPAPAPAVRPAAPAPVAPVPPTLQGDWADWPLTAGDWRYASVQRGSIARFGSADATQFAIRCDRAARRIELARPGRLEAGNSATMTIRATAGAASYPVANSAHEQGYVAAMLAGNDPQLDRMVFSRGRFIVEVNGAPAPLVLPAWPEVARVVEDCR